MKKRVIDKGIGERKVIIFPLTDGDHTYNIVIQPLLDKEDKVIGATSAAFEISSNDFKDET